MGMMCEAELRLGPCLRVNPCCRSNSRTAKAKAVFNTELAVVLVVMLVICLRFETDSLKLVCFQGPGPTADLPPALNPHIRVSSLYGHDHLPVTSLVR